MNRFVIDASAALAWALPSQSTAAAAAFLHARVDSVFTAPHIFSWEVGNVLVTLNRRRNLSGDAYATARAMIGRLDIDLQPALTREAIADCAHMARGLGLSLFDAAYIGLAVECDGALVSRDEDLLAVAKRVAIGCIDLRSEVAP